ncbi:ATP-NAD kinase family protein [Echinimonas agarilytica]|uniref:ATP-NAD kinase family protein n=1 Tax=Echinimonas agarilytica TaxID=1215918 RepID=A0AA42B6X3_9GAMM|nr:ATP-NAD kinase family protein [Echinimonas agarilytica]MCM2679237.1 ATP-NAD kinase family protein [Echinimonas agarilytica]
MNDKLTVAFVINPFAGIGGSVALKGSDGGNTVTEALARGAEPLAQQRAAVAFAKFSAYSEQIHVITAAGDMGEDCARAAGLSTDVIFTPESPSSAHDTQEFARTILALKPDILLFAGGDGTARDVCEIVENKFPVLGIPAGCKIHSGVYAVTPTAAGRMIASMAQGQLLSLTEANVMDIDEDAFRQGVVRAKRYGEMTIPDDLRYLQSVKSGGRESDELVLADIAAEVEDVIGDEWAVMGSGSTVEAVMEHLGLDNTLLGVDVVHQGQLIDSDVTAQTLLDYVRDAQTAVKLVITLIGGQGHIFGRGNQQLSPSVIRQIGRENIVLVASKSKLQALNGRPLIADTGDTVLDQELAGYIRVITGYRDYAMYHIASPE